jgi:hypothetical protein
MAVAELAGTGVDLVVSQSKGEVVKKKKASKPKAVRSLPSKAMNAKKATGVKGGMRKSGGDASTTGKEFLRFKI